jgi:GDP-4-dehydro-6-deoxy-D-mannose reductase
VSGLVADAPPDVCIHLAAIATQGLRGQNEARTWDVSLRLAHALLHYVPDCQMLFVSSADAYGGAGPSEAPIEEDASGLFMACITS